MTNDKSLFDLGYIESGKIVGIVQHKDKTLIATEYQVWEYDPYGRRDLRLIINVEDQEVSGGLFKATGYPLHELEDQDDK
jgi:hypothetical protein